MSYYAACIVDVAGPAKPFYRIAEVRVDSSWQTLTDTATIRLPRSFSMRADQLKSYLPVGAKVRIQLGYLTAGTPLPLVFHGYLTRVTPPEDGSLMTLHCEDAMWLVKQKTFNQSLQNLTLGRLAQVLFGDTGLPWETVDDTAFLGDLRLVNAPGGTVLEDIQRRYALTAYCQNGKFYLGFPRSISRTARRHRLGFGFNVADWNLEYRDGDQVKMKVKAYSIQKDGKRIYAEAGSAEGGTLELPAGVGLTQAEVQAFAQRALSARLYSGYRGSLTTFGQLGHILHGDIAEVEDRRYPERAGDYAIDATQILFEPAKVRYQLTLGKKL